MALRVACSHQTVWTLAIMMVAEITHIHLLAVERSLMYRNKRERNENIPIKIEIRLATLRKQQEEQENAENGSLTRTLIKDVNAWCTRSFGKVNFHLTQLLTGRSCFAYYLHRFKKLNSTACINCQAPIDDIGHTFFQCDRWWTKRRDLNILLDHELLLYNIVTSVLKNKEYCNVVNGYIDGNPYHQRERREKTSTRYFRRTAVA